MECPTCKKEVHVGQLTVEPDAEEDGVEVNFLCPHCGTEHFAVLRPDDFETVD